MKSGRMAIIIALALTVCFLGAEPAEQFGQAEAKDNTLSIRGLPGKSGPGRDRAISFETGSDRYPPSFTFSKLPTAIMTSYWDYMPGSYNNLPLQLIPSSAGGGYFMTWQGKRSYSSQRRVFYTYLDAAGTVINCVELCNNTCVEGYPALAVDPVSGKPFYAWDANVEAPEDWDILLTSDAFIAGIAGLFNPPVNVIDNPISITAPDGTTTTDNVFLWPSLGIGPSPVAGKRRLYVLGRQTENVYLAMADFNALDVEDGNTLSWTYRSVPELDALAADAVPGKYWLALLPDGSGNLYLAGYHASEIYDTDLDVFQCPNFGQGEWTHMAFNSNLETWNPPAEPYGATGYFVDGDGVPYSNTQLYWRLINSGHSNASLDRQGRVHFPGLWALQATDGSYYPELQFLKEAVYDPALTQFQIEDIYPQPSVYDYVNVHFQPWDLEAPWGVAEYGGNAVDGWYPEIFTDWPFPHWEDMAHQDGMMFAYNNVKITQANEQGMLAAVWQDSWRARQFNKHQDDDYTAFAQVPEIRISLSYDNGNYWFEPIVLNSVEVPALQGIKPMWVYPADKMIYMGYNNGHLISKLGLMFYNDFTWGAYDVPPPYHMTPDGGEIMFMELLFSLQVEADDPAQVPAPALLKQNYPNPFNPETTISFELPAADQARLSIHDARGRLVKVLAEGLMGSGRHDLVWDGRDDNDTHVPSGLYFYRLENSAGSESRKMILLK